MPLDFNGAFSAPKGYDMRAPYNIPMGEVACLRVVKPFSISSYQKNAISGHYWYLFSPKNFCPQQMKECPTFFAPKCDPLTGNWFIYKYPYDPKSALEADSPPSGKSNGGGEKFSGREIK